MRASYTAEANVRDGDDGFFSGSLKLLPNSKINMMHIVYQSIAAFPALILSGGENFFSTAATAENHRKGCALSKTSSVLPKKKEGCAET